MTSRTVFPWFVACLLLPACAVPRDVEAPAIELPAMSDSADLDLQNWWQQFGD
jgi:outer membrane protein TolC